MFPWRSMPSLPFFLPLTSQQRPPHTHTHMIVPFHMSAPEPRKSERKQLLSPCTPHPYSCFLLRFATWKCQMPVCIRSPALCTLTSPLPLGSTSTHLLEQQPSRWREIHGDLGRPSHFPGGAFNPWQIIYPRCLAWTCKPSLSLAICSSVGIW